MRCVLLFALAACGGLVAQQFPAAPDAPEAVNLAHDALFENRSIHDLSFDILAAVREPAPVAGASADPQAAAQAVDPKSTKPAPATGPKSAQWPALSVKEKLEYDGRHLFDVENVIFAGMGAAIDQWRDRPSEWGQGWDAYGDRYASHLGYYVIQRSIMFPVQAIDHEDTRFYHSTHTGIKRRAVDAVIQTVWRHNDSGEMMPAYSEFFGDYGAAAISRLWWPDRFHNGKAIFVAGSDTVLIDAGINILHEFAPDIKRMLHLAKK